MTPAAENIRGTSALPYHLLYGRPKYVDVTVYSLNYNNLSLTEIAKTEKELNLKVILLRKSWWVDLCLRNKLGILFRILYPYPIHNYIRLYKADLIMINEKSFDGIWIYGEELSRVSKQFPCYRRVHILPDCESLYYRRLVNQPWFKDNKISVIRKQIMGMKFVRMERNFDHSVNIHYYLVGDEDKKELMKINPRVQAHFIRHPHYNINPTGSAFCSSLLNGRKIKVLIAAQYNTYVKYDADLLINALAINSSLSNDFLITFLGKHWDEKVDILKEAGFDVDYIKFAPDYIKEICKHDIQITPISIGTGTKGKVLDALANGLLVIGTKFALENIAVKDKHSCLQYKSTDELISILKDIPQRIEAYQKIAKAGRDVVLTEHNRGKVSKEMFSLFTL